jgi:bacillithiol biosynthesis deacetylase BshB1
MKLDILAIGIHPDDVELSCSGTLLKHISLGYKCGILDLTEGELGTRGSAELRRKEAAKATEILGLHMREIMNLKDGFFITGNPDLTEVIKRIRKYQPEIVLCNAVSDRHPDHGRASKLVSDACFYSGLRKIETVHEGAAQNPWRPKAVYHYIQDRSLKPDFVVDVTPFVNGKLEAIKAFSSQFFDPESKEPETPISSADFMEFVKAKMRVYGRDIKVEFAEGFTVERVPGVDDLMKLK